MVSNIRICRTILFIGFITMLGIVSCKEFIELPVTEKKIYLNAPVDSLETNKYNLQFWWDFVDDATAYRLQVVNPNFANVSVLVLDTLIKNNKFAYTFAPDKYQWRVRAENGSSKGIYTTRNFTVYESSLRNQQVQQNSPLNGVITKNAEILYSWQPLFGAKSYTIEVDTNNFININQFVVRQSITQNQYIHKLPKSKTYQWRVRAENKSDTSKWSSTQIFGYDGTSLGKVILISPTDNQLTTNRVNLRWNSVSGAVRYELLVFKSDRETLYNSSFPISQTSTNYNFEATSFNEKLYWKVRAIDQAGNEGAYSTLQGFTVQ